MNSRPTPRSPEALAVASATFAILVAALLTLVPPLAFGSFWQMAGIMVGADLVVYVAMKLGWLKMRGSRQ